MGIAGVRLKTLIEADQIQTRIDELAEEIDRDYVGESIALVAILKGSYQFVADLSRRLQSPVTVDFMQVSSYGAEMHSSGSVQIVKDLDRSIHDKHVLIVEDIVDSGLTLQYLREFLQTRRPASIKVVSLLSKPDARRHHTTIEYLGFEIPNRYVVGYGLDHDEQYRNLPFIAVLSS